MKNIKALASGILAVVFIAVSGFTTLDKNSTVKAPTWEIDPVHSNISFEVRHFFTPVNGQFKDYSAQINFSPDNLEESSVNLEIAVSSISTDNEKRDGHLQSDDFFNAEKYPKITFKSDKITKEGENMYVAQGKLTIKDVTKDVKLPFTLLGVQDHPQKEGTKIAGVGIDYSLNRNEFNVGTGSWSETAVVGDEVNISIGLEMQHTAK